MHFGFSGSTFSDWFMRSQKNSDYALKNPLWEMEEDSSSSSIQDFRLFGTSSGKSMKQTPMLKSSMMKIPWENKKTNIDEKIKLKLKKSNLT